MDPRHFKSQAEAELRGNILPFWIKHAVDPVNGGFYGAMTNTLEVHNEVPRSAILCARILWTYSSAYRMFPDPDYLEMAQKAYEYLTHHFWDPVYKGVYWTLDYLGRPANARKHAYAQAFAIYGLAEYYRATGAAESLHLAQELFTLLEMYTHDDVFGGYIEGCSADWGRLDDMRLSEKEIDCQKSMNTLLHILEAFTTLSTVWDDPLVKTRLREVLEIFLDKVIHPATFHFQLFFDERFNSLLPQDSYGHDIEGSWLLLEAAEALGDQALVRRARDVAVKMADVTCREALDPKGGIYYEKTASGRLERSRHWWAQAEAVVGFYNAYQISGEARFAVAAYRTWKYIQDKFVDRVNGDWFKVLDPRGVPKKNQFKTGPWECPYHHSRLCLEIIRRTSEE